MDNDRRPKCPLPPRLLSPSPGPWLCCSNAGFVSHPQEVGARSGPACRPGGYRCRLHYLQPCGGRRGRMRVLDLRAFANPKPTSHCSSVCIPPALDIFTIFC